MIIYEAQPRILTGEDGDDANDKGNTVGWSVRRSQATGLALAGIGSLAVDIKFHIKNREREGGTSV